MKPLSAPDHTTGISFVSILDTLVMETEFIFEEDMSTQRQEKNDTSSDETTGDYGLAIPANNELTNSPVSTQRQEENDTSSDESTGDYELAIPANNETTNSPVSTQRQEENDTSSDESTEDYELAIPANDVITNSEFNFKASIIAVDFNVTTKLELHTNPLTDNLEPDTKSTVVSNYGADAWNLKPFRRVDDFAHLRDSRQGVGNVDIPLLLKRIADLSKTNKGTLLIDKINQTLLGEGLPTLDPLKYDTTTNIYANLTGTIMGKCFVCGLTEKRIPGEALCADAFAGDFLPLLPVNPQARRHVYEFRKYCRWKNIPKFEHSDSRSVSGRWTGGCSVRWVDLSGIYTERACRNRHRASQGISFASKRLAKLEMALQHKDNGCIMSPVSSLLPLSRGISLYARFHVCVCTGNWCNRAVSITHCSPRVAFFAMLWLILEHFIGVGL